MPTLPMWSRVLGSSGCPTSSCLYPRRPRCTASLGELSNTTRGRIKSPSRLDGPPAAQAFDKIELAVARQRRSRSSCMQPDWPDWSDLYFLSLFACRTRRREQRRERVGGRSREPGEASPNGPSGPGLTASTGGPGSRLGGKVYPRAAFSRTLFG